MTDFREIMERARQGDPEAAGELLEPHLDRLAAFVRLQGGRSLRGRESCSDLVQSICRLALEGLDRVEAQTEESFRRWLFSTALHAVINKAAHHQRDRRDVRRELRPPDLSASSLLNSYADLCTPSTQAMAREEVERIEAAYELLPADYRQVLSLRFVAGFDHARIAEEMGRSEEATRKLLHRARARLAILAVDG